jgi:hypothetical protein
MRAVLIIVTAAGVLAGCSSAEQSTPATSAPESSAPAVAAPSPVAPSAAAADPCLLLTPQEIDEALGTAVDGGRMQSNEANNVTQCTFTSADPIAVVVTAVSLEDGQESYDLNAELAPGYFGGEAEEISVPGAEQAYLVIEEELQAPVVGMLIGDQFVQLQVGLEGAPPEQAEQLAATIAGRLD